MWNAVIGIATSRLAGPMAMAGCIALGLMLTAAKMENSALEQRLHAQAAQVEHLRTAYDQWKTYGEGMAASFRAAEALRISEANEARAATASAQRVCRARVDEAQRSSEAITGLLKEEATRVEVISEGACPARRLLDPERVRDALQGAAGRASH